MDLGYYVDGYWHHQKEYHWAVHQSHCDDAGGDDGVGGDDEVSNIIEILIKNNANVNIYDAVIIYIYIY